MSSGPSKDIKESGAKPFGHVDIGLGKGVGASSVGAGIAYTPPSAPNSQVWAGVSQSRGGSQPFAGKPSTSFGVGFRMKF
jgi:hypothetical protein